MKKFWMISMLLIAALFVISCGDGEEEGGEGGACTTQGAFRCSGDMLQKCDQEAWKPFENCADSGKTCNAETGKCEAKGGNDNADSGNEGGNDDNGDSGNNEPTTPTDPTNPTDPANALTCSEIYQCMVDCGQDGTCQQGCFDKGDATSQAQLNALLQCLNTCNESSSTDEEFQNCANAQCATEISNCGLGGGDPADTSYNSPYGSATLNFSTQYIYVNQNDQSQDGFVMSPFANGSIGNTGSFSLAPADAYATISYAMAMQGMVAVVQMPYYAQGQQAVPGTLAVQLVFDANTIAVGSGTIGLTQDDLGQMYVLDEENGQECMHAIAMGDVSINALENITTGGAGSALALTGNVTFYSPKNGPGYGDITNAFSTPVVACSVR